jgi:hypothetical protein
LHPFESTFLKLTLHETHLEFTHLGVETDPEGVYVLSNLSYCSWSAGYFAEADTVWTFKLECLSNSLFFVVIQAESLPLSVDAMNASTWENSS